jgi:hypothetical protein
MAGKRKLTAHQVLVCRVDRARRDDLMASLARVPTEAQRAKEYGVSQATIHHAATGTNYQDVNP